MIVYKYLIIVIIVFSSSRLFSQEYDFQYSHSDSLAMRVKYNGDIVSLSKQLVTPFSDETLKARAIFIWITYNIAYDFKYYNRQANKGDDQVTFHCPSDDSLSCVIKEKVWENEYINKALDRKKAVCQGYAMLFKRMCEIAGIHAEVVPGYTRTEYYEVGTPGELDHAWNAVQLNGNYYLLDATWAAGICTKGDDDKLKSFIRVFNSYYWLTPPDEFVRNHFPEDPKWVLLPKFTIDKFSANPYYDPDELKNIKLLAPASGLIKARKGDTIRFKLRYAGHIKNLQINTNIFQNPDIWSYIYNGRRKFPVRIPDSMAIKQQRYVEYHQKGDIYEFTYVIRDNTLDYLEILFDRRRVMRFKINNWR